MTSGSSHSIEGPQALVAAIAAALLRRRAWLGVAESCTGGLIAQWLTDRPGSSAWFERGLITYSNQAKQELLGVPEDCLVAHGAVSREVAEAMALGLRARAPVDWSIAVTGIAGPGGGSPDKPVGLVWMAWASAAGVSSAAHHFAGDRAAVRAQAAQLALQGLLERLGADEAGPAA